MCMDMLMTHQQHSKMKVHTAVIKSSEILSNVRNSSRHVYQMKNCFQPILLWYNDFSVSGHKLKLAILDNTAKLYNMYKPNLAPQQTTTTTTTSSITATTSTNNNTSITTAIATATI